MQETFSKRNNFFVHLTEFFFLNKEIRGWFNKIQKMKHFVALGLVLLTFIQKSGNF